MSMTFLMYNVYKISLSPHMAVLWEVSLRFVARLPNPVTHLTYSPNFYEHQE